MTTLPHRARKTRLTVLGRALAVALGVSYNVGRAISALAPWLIGRLGEVRGLGWAFLACGIAYAGAALSALLIPETTGRDLR